ncbi:MAG: adenylate/guanylate cyclase domain-containing protein [Chloroflexota bacterium]
MTIRDTVMRYVRMIGADPLDDADTRLLKVLLVGTTLMILPAAVLWGFLYVVFGEPRAGLIPWSYAILSAGSLVVLQITRRLHWVANFQLLIILVIPAALMLALGGFVASSGAILWSALAPLGSIAFESPRRAIGWFVAFLGVLVGAALVGADLRTVNSLPSAVVLLFFVLNLAGPATVAFVLLVAFASQREAALGSLRVEQHKADTLLLNILPRRIADILKGGQRQIAEGFDSATILFADVVDFTPLSARLEPAEVVELLDHLFSHFDTLAERHGLEKIKTIGDAYMVAAGVPAARPDHAQAIARLAIDMRESLAAHGELAQHKIQVRIGINSGPVVAGVIGRRRFIYDLWGDAVNVASRMESQGAPGMIQVTRATHDLIADTFVLEPHGTVAVKGRGEVETWFLVGPR